MKQSPQKETQLCAEEEVVSYSLDPFVSSFNSVLPTYAVATTG